MSKAKVLWVCVTLTITINAAINAGENAQTIKTGVDNLVDTQFEMIASKQVVLVTHAAARVYTGRTTAQEFQRSQNVNLLRILTPEHGYYGVVKAGEHVADSTLNGTPLLSLYGANRRPTAMHLAGANVVVLDLQDIGTRSYTYISTMVEVMYACAERGLPLVILDRPNPLGGLVVDGPIPDSGVSNFVCRVPVPYVHGLTMGELATMANAMGWLGQDPRGAVRRCSLTVVKVKRWHRDITWNQTGLPWIPTSPNIPTISSVQAYPVTGLLGEIGGLSVGIGTTTPFMVVGRPGSAMPDSTLSIGMARYGILATEHQFLPYSGSFANKICYGWLFQYQAASEVRPFTAGMFLLYTLQRMGIMAMPSTKADAMFNKVCGSTRIAELLVQRAAWLDIEAFCSRGCNEFKRIRKPFLLY